MFVLTEKYNYTIFFVHFKSYLQIKIESIKQKKKSLFRSFLVALEKQNIYLIHAQNFVHGRILFFGNPFYRFIFEFIIWYNNNYYINNIFVVKT